MVCEELMAIELNQGICAGGEQPRLPWMELTVHNSCTKHPNTTITNLHNIAKHPHTNIKSASYLFHRNWNALEESPGELSVGSD